MKTGNVEGKVEQDIYGTKPSPYRMVGKVAVASREEQEINPRSRSAKLRIGEKRK
jgi:16S rRNA (cytosine1402-N4)-methyltransferase